MSPRRHSRRRARSRGAAGRGSLDRDLLDPVSDLDPRDDVHSRGDLTEVRVLLVEEGGVFLDHEPLAVVVERRILAARDAGRAELEAEVVVLARHTLAACPGPLRIATLAD